MTLPADQSAPELLLGMLKAAVAEASPGRYLHSHVPEKPAGRTIVVGAGKAAAEFPGVLVQGQGQLLLHGGVQKNRQAPHGGTGRGGRMSRGDRSDP